MQSIWKSKGKKLHTRSIEVTSYNYDGQKIIVEGYLKDDRLNETYMISTGKMRPSGILHHITIRLLVNCSNFLIEDVNVNLITIPTKACRETVDCLAPIKGMTITKGFTSKVKKLIGGNKGCTHLVELLLAMAPAAFQGFGAHQTQKSSFDSGQANKIFQLLANSCHAWREDGPLVKNFKKIYNNRI